ncbi:hypothetical protein BC829DRAFT_3194 [Chytridium lagenaria]|nr:hypothetical protein BC829DRAFT_3194 [Chytridium lagenaria]
MNPFQIKGEVPPPKRITVELSIEERVVVRAPCDRDHHDAVLTSNPAFHESAVGLGMLEEGRSSSESDFGSRDDLGNRGDAFFERLAEGPLYISEDKAIGSSSSGYGEPGGGKVVGRRKLVRVPTPPHLVGVQTKTSIRGRTRLLKAGGDTERWVKSLETRKEVATWKWTEEAEGDFSTERACTIIVPPVFSAPDVTSPPEGLIHPYSDDDKDSISNAETTTTIIPSPDYKRKVRQGRPKDQVINNSISQKL